MASKKKPAVKRMGKAIEAIADGKRVISQSITQYGMKALRIYGDEVNLDRATPDLKDGLKPVQRRIIFGASSNPKGVKVKSARIVGDVMGKFHPHGDKSIYDAMVTMVRSCTPLILGSGNWGNLIDGAAAMRYTEAQASNFGRTGFDGDYVNKEVTPFVPNYDGKEEEPLYIPYPLPIILFNGGSGIGYAAASNLPSFTPESVADVLKRLLSGEKLKPEDFARIMKPTYKYGGQFVNTKANKEAWLQMFTSHKASVQFQSPLKVDVAKRQIVINEWPAGVNPTNVSETLKTFDYIQEVYPSKGSSEITILIKKGYNTVQFEEFVGAIQKMTRAKQSFNINVTNREVTIVDGLVDYEVTLMKLSVPKLVIAWLRARLVTEAKSLTYRIKKQQAAIAYSKLMVFAAINIETIIPIVRYSKTPKEDLCKKLKIEMFQAEQIMELKLRQLGRLDQNDLKQKIKEQKQHLAQLEAWQKKPKKKMLGDIDIAMQSIEADRKFILKQRTQKLVLQ